MAEARVTNPLVGQFRRGGVARDLRLMAAQGLLPLKSEDLLELWCDLVNDGDEAVRSAAASSLGSFAAAELLPVLKNRDTSPPVLAWAATHRSERELREAALQNTSTKDETIEVLAPNLPQELAELVVINQVRLLRRTSLLEAVESNPHLSNDQRRRLRELRETFKIGVVEAPPPAPPPAAEPEAPPPPPEPEPEPVKDVSLSEDEALVRYLSEEERQQAEKVSTVQKLYRLNTAKKLITALKGFREERAILIRDLNPLVWSAVLDSPRLTEAEIRSFSAMENVSGQVLRHIGNHPEWTKHYAVINNLVRNPRTPTGIALRLISHLKPPHLRGISVDRRVPEAVRKAAQSFLELPRSYAADPVAARELCTRLWRDYLETVKGSQPVKIASWFTKDAVLIFPDMPALSGRDAIQAHLLKALEGTKISELAFTLDRFEVVGRRAFTFVSLDQLVQQGSGPPTRSQARCGVVWQRQADNTWQISYFLANHLTL